MSYQRICVPVALQRYVAFTPVALRQRDLALLIAGDSEATVYVISVDAPVGLMPGSEPTEAKLNRYVERFAAAGVEHQTAYRKGKPSREVREYIDAINADLVVIGSHSKRGPFDVGIGSTASVLSRKTEVPVLMVWPTPDEVDRADELKIPSYPVVFPYG